MKTSALILLLLSLFYSTQAQNILSTAGGSVTGENIVIDWTIGEAVSMTLTSGGKSATQGFQQPVLVPEFTFSDPCACDDIQNVIGRDGFIVRYHDVITISSTSGDAVSNPFKIVGIIAGEVLTADGSTIVGSTTALSVTEGDNQVIDLWRPMGMGYQVTIEDTITGERFDVGTEIDCIPCPQIPSMGAWALLIFFLTLTNIALIQLYKIQIA